MVDIAPPASNYGWWMSLVIGPMSNIKERPPICASPLTKQVNKLIQDLWIPKALKNKILLLDIFHLYMVRRWVKTPILNMFYYTKLGVNKYFRYIPKYITCNTCL